MSVVGLTLHELATNANKYGALSNESGSIDIDWRVEDYGGNRTLVIDWKVTGGPAIAGAPEVNGTGFSIARSLLSHSRVSLETDWRPEGLHAILTIPVQG